MYKCAIYTRVSTEEQAENPEGSIKNQEQRLREFVRLKNSVESFGEVVAVFSDPGVSAPGFFVFAGWRKRKKGGPEAAFSHCRVDLERFMF